MKSLEKRAPIFAALFPALVSFLLYLFAYGLFLFLEAALGGGQAFLWFLTFAPPLFVLFQVASAVWIALKNERVFILCLLQFSALVLALLTVFSADLVTGRSMWTSLAFSDFILDLAALAASPVLLFSGARVGRFWRQHKRKK